METNIRALKAGLSGLIRRVVAGETVSVSVRNRRVARIVPIGEGNDVKALAGIRGLAWRGGKPSGLVRGEQMPRGVELPKWVAGDRR